MFINSFSESEKSVGQTENEQWIFHDEYFCLYIPFLLTQILSVKHLKPKSHFPKELTIGVW